MAGILVDFWVPVSRFSRFDSCSLIRTCITMMSFRVSIPMGRKAFWDLAVRLKRNGWTVSTRLITADSASGAVSDIDLMLTWFMQIGEHRLFKKVVLAT